MAEVFVLRTKRGVTRTRLLPDGEVKRVLQRSWRRSGIARKPNAPIGAICGTTEVG